LLAAQGQAVPIVDRPAKSRRNPSLLRPEAPAPQPYVLRQKALVLPIQALQIFVVQA
jgi:hypothetical protein